MSKDWNGLRYWDNGRHGNLAIKFWKQHSIEELKVLTMNEMKWTYSTRLHGSMTYTDTYEESKSKEAIASGYTNYKESDFNYFINEFGFRGNWTLGDHSKSSLGVFGCSFTFGIGLPEHDSYPNMFGNHLNCQVYNFGVPGGSINRATRYYSLVSNYQKFDYVIFLVPHFGRMEMPKPIADTEPYIMNIIPNWNSTDKKEEALRQQIYMALDDNFLEFDTLKNISQCTDIAKANGTKIYFSSWDMPTYDLIYDFLGEDSGMLLPWFEVLEFQSKTKINLARDGDHPGPTSHTKFFERSIPYLK